MSVLRLSKHVCLEDSIHSAINEEMCFKLYLFINNNSSLFSQLMCERNSNKNFTYVIHFNLYNNTMGHVFLKNI